jgi:hypothetical protein
MPDADARASEIRDLEAKLEQYLLVLDHGAGRGVEGIRTQAIVATIQRRLERLRGTVTTVNAERRAEMLAYLARTSGAGADE